MKKNIIVNVNGYLMEFWELNGVKIKDWRNKLKMESRKKYEKKNRKISEVARELTSQSE